MTTTPNQRCATLLKLISPSPGAGNFQARQRDGAPGLIVVTLGGHMHKTAISPLALRKFGEDFRYSKKIKRLRVGTAVETYLFYTVTFADNTAALIIARPRGKAELALSIQSYDGCDEKGCANLAHHFAYVERQNEMVRVARQAAALH